MKQTVIARKLRNTLTDAEKHLWYILRAENLGYKFRRQAQIGNYIVDFVCYDKRLIIEIDGGQHFENMEDKARDTWLRSEGFTVLRFWNNEVLENRDAVLEKIVEHLKQ
ncbi:MAG: ATP-dependent helicase HrpA [Candidatus Doudnabacteria bacterium RIFCSPLOWO2_02_FULL_49_13]|nr:MAG: ATP-dependent helicase HrpA [Candidatus Doudnabacteria bacterium RIFCSPLOWO2_02_FULL_49_13]